METLPKVTKDKLVALGFAGLGFMLSGCSALRRLAAGVFGDPAVEPGPIDPQTLIIQKTWWLIPGAIILAVAATFMFFQGRIKWSLSLGAAAVVGLVLSITVFAHFTLIGWIVLGAGCIALAYALYLAYTNSKAVPELVKSHEVLANELPPISRGLLHGKNDVDHGLIGDIQSKATERLVKRAKAKLRKLNGSALLTTEEEKQWEARNANQ